MNLSDQRLLRHLVLAVLIKLVLLFILWWLFIRDAQVSVEVNQALKTDPERTAKVDEPLKVEDVAGKINRTIPTQATSSQGASK